MDILDKKEAIILVFVTVVEAILVWLYGFSAFSVLVLANVVVIGGYSITETVRFVNLMKNRQSALYYKHLNAFNSYNTLLIKLATKKEVLREDERIMINRAVWHLRVAFLLSAFLACILFGSLSHSHLG